MNVHRKKVFLGRQPILDRRKKIYGYELLFRATDTFFADINDVSFAVTSVISNVLTTFSMNEVLGKHKGFINVSAELLESEALEILPAERVVIELLETIEPSLAVISRCRELKELGFKLALDDNQYHVDFEPLYGIVDVVKIDILQTPSAVIRKMVSLLRNRGLILLAEKVETSEQYEECFNLGFHLFQGYFFARPSVLKTRGVDPVSADLLKLLKLVCADAEIKEIEEIFKHNPNLTYNLLRLVNSVVIGLRERIRTLRHALVVLGMIQLKRWIQLSLFASEKAGGEGNPLLETAATRGRLMEILARSIPDEISVADNAGKAFMTGVLSLIDVLLELPMEEVIGQLNLTSDIRRALLRREGYLGGLLRLTESLERLDFQDVGRLLDEFGCSMDLLMKAQVEAFEWVNNVSDAI